MKSAVRRDWRIALRLPLCNGGSPTSHTPAHESTATVAPFRAWRGSLSIIARGPIISAALLNLNKFKWLLILPIYSVTRGVLLQASN